MTENQKEMEEMGMWTGQISNGNQKPIQLPLGLSKLIVIIHIQNKSLFGPFSVYCAY